MKEDIWRFLAVVGLSLLAGWSTGQVMLCLVSGLLLFIWWHYQNLRELLQWMERKAPIEPPVLPGVMDQISREFDLLRLHHKQRKKKLTRHLKRFQASTAALPDAVVVLGKYGVIQWANEKASAYLGISLPRDAGQRITNLVRLPELGEFLAAARKIQPDRGLQLTAPGNAALILELRISRYGKSQKLLVARDVTRIQQVNQMRRDFIANASHELRTPLTVIAGYLEGLEDDPIPEPEILRRQIGQMRQQADQMQHLIEDLLQLASLESSLRPETNEPIPVPELLAAIDSEARTLSGEIRHRITLEMDHDLWLYGSRNELYSAFSNIVHNAVAYTPAEGSIHLRWYADTQGAHFEVADTGLGIEAQHIPRLTERFYRIDKGRSRDKGGTGLGLAIVRHVLERHNAILNIQSVPGEGSLFHCNFPLGRIVRRESVDRQDHTA